MTVLARWARAEWGRLYVAVREPLRERRGRAVPMTVGAVCLTGLLHFAQNRSWGYGLVQAAGTVRAEDPLWAALLRTPLSLFVPALDLPAWGALAQVLVVFGVAEICLGRRLTLVVAYAATLAGTLYARVGVALGPGGPLGLSRSDAQVVDTGPSAAVVGLAVFLARKYGAHVTVGAVAGAMVLEVALKANLAGKEHLAAIAAALLLRTAPPLPGDAGHDQDVDRRLDHDRDIDRDLDIDLGHNRDRDLDLGMDRDHGLPHAHEQARARDSTSAAAAR